MPSTGEERWETNMPVVFIPALLRELTGGQQRVSVTGETVREVIDALDQQFPGLRAGLLEEDRLRPGIAVVVDGQVSARRLRQRLEPGSEVHFLPSISGGMGPDSGS